MCAAENVKRLIGVRLNNDRCSKGGSVQKRPGGHSYTTAMVSVGTDELCLCEGEDLIWDSTKLSTLWLLPVDDDEELERYAFVAPYSPLRRALGSLVTLTLSFPVPLLPSLVFEALHRSRPFAFVLFGALLHVLVAPLNEEIAVEKSAIASWSGWWWLQ